MSVNIADNLKEENVYPLAAPAEDLEQDALNENSDENKRAPEEEKREELKREYGVRKIYTPLRFLALTPLYKSTVISLDEFDRLREAVIGDDTITKIPRHKHEITPAETIIRACHLLFALVESGALVGGAPEREITRLKINTTEARFGLLQPVSSRVAHQSGAAFSEDGENYATVERFEPETEEAAFLINGLRQPLHALGRFHLNSFIRSRLLKQKAWEGENLLPKLTLKRDDLPDIIKHLPWLASLPNKSNISWQNIFRHWLSRQLLILCGVPEKVNWSNLAQLAAWRILHRERYPFLIAARRRLFQSVPLPESTIKSIFAVDIPEFNKAIRSPLPAKETAREIINEKGSRLIIENEQNYLEADDVEDEILPKTNRRLSSSGAETNYQYVSQVLTLLRGSREKKRNLSESLLAQAASPALNGAGEKDLRNLLRCGAQILESSEVSTAHTYTVKVLRALYAMSQMPFADWRTEDVAEYLENYAPGASVKSVRNALQQFDRFLVGEKLADDKHIVWNSRSLQSPASYSARDALSNAEYKKVRETIIVSAADESSKLRHLCLLTLLRRCGLRSGEAAWLTPRNFFKGYSKWELEITHSKTRAGLRKLPLFLLLDEQEIGEMRQFTRRQNGDLEKPLFADEEGNYLTAHSIGRQAEKLLRRAGIEDETAHGLRRAFASSLFASFWLNLTEKRIGENESSLVRRALKQYARPESEGRAVPELVFMQQLLGHADLRVTFERYIHLLELVGADAVWLYENDNAIAPDSVSLMFAANILGMDEKLMRREVGSVRSGAVNLYEVARISSSRLP